MDDPSDKVSWDLDANGYRLPLEKEWEWAARSGVCKRKRLLVIDNN